MNLSPIILLLINASNKDVDVQKYQLVTEDTNNLNTKDVKVVPPSNNIGTTDFLGTNLYQHVLLEQLYNNIVSSDYDNAVALTFALEQSNTDVPLGNVVNRLISNSERNVVEYAYRLWLSGGKTIVSTYFPVQFKNILNGDKIKFTNERDGLAVKLDANTDRDGDRPAWGDDSDKSVRRLTWKFIPIWENNKVYFKMYNTDRSQYLKLALSPDSAGDRKAYGSNDDETNRHQWYLHPVYFKNNIVFFIYNRKYTDALKLGRWVDDIGDRILWSHNGNVLDQPELFAWRIEAV